MKRVLVVQTLLLLVTVACAPEVSTEISAAGDADVGVVLACPANGNEVIGPNTTSSNVGVFGLSGGLETAKAAGDAALPQYLSDHSKCGPCNQANTAEIYITTKPRPSRYKCPTPGGPWTFQKTFTQTARDCKGDTADEVQGWFQQTFQKGKGVEGKQAYQNCGDDNCSFEIAQTVSGPTVTGQNGSKCTASATAKVEYKCVDYRDGWDLQWEIRHGWTCVPKAAE